MSYLAGRVCSVLAQLTRASLNVMTISLVSAARCDDAAWRGNERWVVAVETYQWVAVGDSG